MPKTAIEAVRLGSLKWMVRQVRVDGRATTLGFVQFHQGKYEVIRIGSAPTRKFFTSEQEAFGYFVGLTRDLFPTGKTAG